MKHKVSVIVPAYNCGRYIGKTAECLLRQTYGQTEIIIVNDGSTDDTAEKLAEIAKNEPSVIVVSQQNSGVSAARNAGIEKATGDYIMFMDADDEVSENWVENSVRAVTEHNADIAASGYLVFNRKTGLPDSQSNFSECIQSREQFIDRIFRHRDILPAIWNKIFRADIIRQKNIRFNKRYTIGEDLLFLLQYCLYIKKAFLSADQTYFYYLDAQSAMNSHQGTGEFKESWLTEWYSIKAADACLHKNGIKAESIRIKKVRIANKLLAIIEKYHYDTPVKQELLRYLRKNACGTIMAKEFGIKVKMSILLNCISPALRNRINRR